MLQSTALYGKIGFSLDRLVDRLVYNIRTTKTVIPLSTVTCVAFASMAAITIVGPKLLNIRFAPFFDVSFIVWPLLLVDLGTRLAGWNALSSRATALAYGFVLLALFSYLAAFSSYIVIRFDMPLQDQIFLAMDRAMGVDWMGTVRWFDAHPALERLLQFAYGTLGEQLIFTLAWLALAGRFKELRIYISTFAVTTALTIMISGLVPAMTQMPNIDVSSFHAVKFVGQEPAGVVSYLRQSGPVIVTHFAGMISFPSLHAGVAVLVPLCMRRTRAFWPLVILDALMMVSSMPEGVHYVSDLVAGTLVALFSYWLVEKAEHRHRNLKPFSSSEVDKSKLYSLDRLTGSHIEPRLGGKPAQAQAQSTFMAADL